MQTLTPDTSPLTREARTRFSPPLALPVLVRAHQPSEMSLVVYPLRKRPVGGTITLMHLSDDNLRFLFDLVEIPLALKLTCRWLRSLAPAKTKTKVAHVVRGIGLTVWAHQCGLFEHVETNKVAELAAMNWPGGDEAIEYIHSPRLYHHDLTCSLFCADLCVFAARAGLIPMLKCLGSTEMLMTLDSKEHFSDAEHARTLCAAAGAGHLECVKWVLAQNKERPSLVPSYDALDAAATTGQLEVVRWLMGQFSVIDTPATVSAATNGHVQVLDLLIKAGSRWTDSSATQCFKTDTCTPPLATIQYLITNGLAWAREATWDEAVSHGQVETVAWLASNDPEGTHFHGDSGDALWFAAARGCTAILRLASDHGVHLDPDLCDRVASYNRLETLEFLHSKGVVGSQDAVTNAICGGGHIAILECLRAHGGYGFPSSLYMDAAADDRLAVLEWLESIHCPLPSTESNRQDMLFRSVENGNQQMAEWMLAHGCGTLRSHHAFLATCNQDVEMLNWLLKSRCPYDLHALRRACASDFDRVGASVGAIVAKLCQDAGLSPPFATFDPDLCDAAQWE